MPVGLLTKPSERRSKRLRRVGWTVAALSVLVGIAAVVTWRIRRDNQPEEYVPGEQSRDITDVGSERPSRPTQPTATAKTTVTGRRIDHLLDPGKRLPAGAPQPLFTDVTKEAGLDGYREFQGARTSQLPEETWTNVGVDQVWDVVQGQADLKPFVAGAVLVSSANAVPTDTTSTTVQFWAKQHAAMDAMKREHDFPRAAALFRDALALNPNHEDSHYYLANCYAALENIPAALSELDTLTRINPQNHRAFQRKGELMSAAATSRNQLAAARDVLSSALRLNSEETGTLVLLGEVDLARAELDSAEMRFAHVCQANPRAMNAWYFRGYVAWKRHDAQKSIAMLNAAREALGPAWKPTGAVLEGDVRQRMFSESGFLGLFAQQWDGKSDPNTAYAGLDAYLRKIR